MTMRDSITAAKQAGPVALAGGEHGFEFNFAAGDPVFAGHFPHRPLLPGIFQLEMARMAAEWVQHRPFSIREISRAKFQRPVIPGETLKLNLKLTEADGTISARATFICGGQPAGEAQLKLA